jgi:hypothetical protein
MPSSTTHRTAAGAARRLEGHAAAQHRPPEYPKTVLHPGYPNGGVVKDDRGKDANQVVWKFEGALEARIADDLRQAAIEEG